MTTNLVPKAVPKTTRKTAAAGRATRRPSVPAVEPAVASKPPPRAGKAPLPAPKVRAKSAPTTQSTTATGTARDGKATSASKDKPKKSKLVRDSFTMPEQEYAALSEVKKACLKAGFEVKKSELLRIGVALVRALELPALQQAVAGLSPLKPGRPRKEK